MLIENDAFFLICFQIRDVNTSSEVQRVLAEAIIEMDLSNITQLPFLLHMPPRYLLQLNNSEVRQMWVWIIFIVFNYCETSTRMERIKYNIFESFKY